MLDKDTIDEVMRTRAAHIESFSAAFLQQVGSAEASRYKLVETQEKPADGSFRVTWEFLLVEDDGDRAEGDWDRATKLMTEPHLNDQCPDGTK
tara:strand:- start:18243 stop:18521 length:279 start_codon:yes stop_codon:yes gene_type:complete